MTEQTLSGAGGDPSQGAGPGSTPADSSSFQVQQESPAAAAAEGGGQDTSTRTTAAGEPARPRRRRRGGARRRKRNGRPADEPVEDSSEEGGAPVEVAWPEEDDGPGGEGARGKGASGSASSEGGPELEEARSAASPAGPAEGTEAEASTVRKRRRKRRRKGTQAENGPAEARAGVDDAQADVGAGGSEEGETGTGPATDQDEGDAAEEPSGGEGKKRRRRKRRRRSDSPAPEPEREDSAQERDEEPTAPARGRRRGGRSRTAGGDGPVAVEGIPGEDDELDGEEATAEAEPETDREAAGARARGQRERAAPKRRGGGRKNSILVNASDREETRVAVVEGERICDFQMTSRRHKSLVNDIYRGRVVNLEPAIGAAFIDFGQGRNGFLHTSDVLSAYGEEDWKLEKLLTTSIDPEEWDQKSSQPDVAAELDDVGGAGEGADEAEPPAREEAGKGRGRGRRERGRGGRPRARPRLPIGDLLEKGDVVVVQVTKDAIGDKGPTLTTYISIPGRYLVLMPSMTRTGVSRKIEDDKERRRLKRILEGLEVPPGMGVIVRTAGTGCTKAEIKRDLDYLLLLWESFGQRLTLGRGPAALYEESDVVIRTIRDLFTDDTEAVVVDDAKVHKRVAEFVEKLMPENLGKVVLHEGPRPLFHTHNVEQDFERIFARRIDLPSGGSIVFDQTEALVAIDVNSGKTRSEGFDFEDIALRTNLDAVPEIARQIRLRDLGGIIVVDFIDMLKSSHRRQVERALRDAMAGDRARSKLGRISQFGLLELTRQRLGPGLSKILFQNCPRCRGSGRLRTVESRSEAILRRLGSALTLKGFTRVEVRAAPEVVEHLEGHYSQALKDLEGRHQRELTLMGVPDQVDDSVLRYLRADGREVRPGGRRKR